MKLVRSIVGIILISVTALPAGCTVAGFIVGSVADAKKPATIAYEIPVGSDRAARRQQVLAMLQRLYYGDDVELILVDGTRIGAGFVGIVKSAAGADSAVALDQNTIGLEMIDRVGVVPPRNAKWTGLGIGLVVDAALSYAFYLAILHWAR